MTTSLGPLLRQLSPGVLGALVRRHRELAACEDALQDAMIAAADQWPRTGVPPEPRAWLIHVASRRLTDALRTDAARRARETEALALAAPEAPDAERDDSLDLFFLCCQPALSQGSAIALTLRAVGGLTTAEIARAFLVPEATMAQRLSRARQAIKHEGLTAEPLTPAQRRERLPAVMRVLYLVFNEGYAATSGPHVHRVDLAHEAMRLTRLLKHLLPGEPEVMGLLALMLLTDARRAARTGPAGELVPLDEQDRAKWNRVQIDEGAALIDSAFSQGAVGPYQLQAAIASLHDAAASTEATDWKQIAALYEVLARVAPSPLVSLSHAIAVAMTDGPGAGLARLDALEHELAGNHRFDAAKAHLLERAGRRAEAAALFRRASEHTHSTAERDYLLLKASRLDRA